MSNPTFYPSNPATEIISPNPVQAPARVHALLDRLHALSTEQEENLVKERDRYPNSTKEDFDNLMRDKFIALDQDKCRFMYQLILATGAKNVVEAGTSFGVSTIYLALAVLSNLQAGGGQGGVIATENEPSKAVIARQNWADAGEGISEVIDLREGDILQTLKVDMPTVDMLLLDIWSPLAFPTLQIVEPHFKKGAVVLIDNTISSASRYKDLLSYLRAPGSGYTSLTLPHHNGFEMCIYQGRS